MTPLTLDNHLAGVSSYKPHPRSYRPDLPLVTIEHPRIQAARDEAYLEGYKDAEEEESEASFDRGKEEGLEEGKKEAREELADAMAQARKALDTFQGAISDLEEKLEEPPA